MCQIKIQTTVIMFYILENLSFNWVCQYRVNWIDQGQRSLNTTAGASPTDSVTLTVTLDCLNEAEGNIIFELICSNEIFINSNKNHYFLQFKLVKKGLYVLFLVRYISNNMQPIFPFLLHSTIEFLFVCLS